MGQTCPYAVIQLIEDKYPNVSVLLVRGTLVDMQFVLVWSSLLSFVVPLLLKEWTDQKLQKTVFRKKNMWRPQTLNLVPKQTLWVVKVQTVLISQKNPKIKH